MSTTKEYCIFITSFMLVPTSLTIYYTAPYIGIMYAYILWSFFWANIAWIYNKKLNKRLNKD